MSRRVAVAMTPDREAHLTEKQAALRERRRPQIYLLCDEAETRAIAAGRLPALAELRRQARAALRYFAEVADA